MCEPLIRSLGYECVHLELIGPAGRRVLRFYIDAADGISVADCATISRQIEVVLDVEDIVNGAYTLEVSSPGLDRPLGRLSDFERFVGQEVRITTRDPLQNRRKWSGVLAGTESGNILLSVDGGETVSIPAAKIRRANLKYAFDEGGEARR